jgi:hypothetical protein
MHVQREFAQMPGSILTRTHRGKRRVVGEGCCSFLLLVAWVPHDRRKLTHGDNAIRDELVGSDPALPKSYRFYWPRDYP